MATLVVALCGRLMWSPYVVALCGRPRSRGLGQAQPLLGQAQPLQITLTENLEYQYRPRDSRVKRFHFSRHGDVDSHRRQISCGLARSISLAADDKRARVF